jgi:hypothetical protein
MIAPCTPATICFLYNTHTVTAGETVVALRSNGERTVATIEKVKEGGTVELVVGEGLQKAVRSAAVGKLAKALDDFVRDSIKRQSPQHPSKKHSSRNLKHLKPLSDSDFWARGLEVDIELLARLRDLELQEEGGGEEGTGAVAEPPQGAAI